MKKYQSLTFLTLAFLLLASACNNGEEELLFEKSADERAEEAITNLEQKLAAPPNGWILRYQPVDESGTYVVLLNFDQEGGMRIRTDFTVNDNEFYDQANTYRVDNSMGLELIFESYSFFSYLFEQNGASFLAEYEFDYINETPDGDLVFRSKTDPGISTTLVFQPAPENAETLLGREFNSNLDQLSQSLGVISPVYRLDYQNRDLSLFLSFNTFLRRVNFTYSSPISGNRVRSIDFSTGYAAQGSSLILDEPLVGNYFGNEVNIPAIDFRELSDAADVEACNQIFDIQQYRATIAGEGDAVALLPTIFDPGGAEFQNESGTYLANPGDIYQNGVSVGNQVTQDIEGMIGLVMYYFDDSQSPFIALGFGLVQNDELVVPVRNFTPTYTDNQIDFAFEMDYEVVIGDTTAVLDTASMNVYLKNITEGGSTRILQTTSSTYELYNPCTGWSAIMQRL